jgi:pentatricopeptide repeat protein
MPGVQSDAVTYATLVKACVQAKEWQRALRLYEHALAEVGGWPAIAEVMQICRSLQLLKKNCPWQVSWQVLSHGSCLMRGLLHGLLCAANNCCHQQLTARLAAASRHDLQLLQLPY